MQAELVLDCKNQHGEGVLWNPHDGCVWWTDIFGKQIWTFDPKANTSKSYPFAERVCCFAPCENGQLIIAFADRVSIYDLDTAREEKVCDFEADTPNTRLNDGRTDRQGRFIVGGMDEVSGKPVSSVISIGKDRAVQTLIEGVACANSICFSPDGDTMYFADTPNNEVLAMAYDAATGSLLDRGVLASFADEPGLPDGSCVDAQGGVWNAEWEGRRVVRIAPNGSIDTVIDVPSWKPTCCAFGGENLDTLFITTSRLMSDDDVLASEPTSGGLFAVKPGFTGVRDTPFQH
ncbi:MAG: SMP-30/gluconolactonase/LRE family protein [Thalassovita sp.]